MMASVVLPSRFRSLAEIDRHRLSYFLMYAMEVQVYARPKARMEMVLVDSLRSQFALVLTYQNNCSIVPELTEASICRYDWSFIPL